jgi:hypothetical protein
MCYSRKDNLIFRGFCFGSDRFGYYRRTLQCAIRVPYKEIAVIWPEVTGKRIMIFTRKEHVQTTNNPGLPRSETSGYVSYLSGTPPFSLFTTFNYKVSAFCFLQKVSTVIIQQRSSELILRLDKS